MGIEFELPDLFNSADYFVDRNVREGRADKVAVYCEDRQVTYGEIQRDMNRFGNGLKSLGVRREERVALLLLDTEVYPKALFGAIKIGAVSVCLNTLMMPADYEYFLNDSRARVLVADKALLEKIEPIRNRLKYVEAVLVAHGAPPAGMLSFEDLLSCESPELEVADTGRDDACFWLYSSGTTGRPKGTVHLQHDMAFSAEAYGKGFLGIREDDVTFSIPKTFFAYGLGNNVFFPFSVGAAAIYNPGRPTPESVFELVGRYKPTLFFSVPTMYGQMLQVPGSMERARICVSGGEAIPPELWRQWKERFGLEVLDGIGSTEMLHIYIGSRVGEVRFGSTGKEVPGYEARIVDEEGRPVARGDTGTLQVRGHSSAAYYWNKQDKSQEVMLGPWINTGDKFYQDQDGYYYYAGRADDMLKAGGIWVSPIEVEGAIMEHASVLECAVVGAEDADGLQKPKAYVVLKKGFEPTAALAASIQAHVKKSLAGYKYPRWVEFREVLPKTATGKLKRFELRSEGAAPI